jgi:hypothetical protein
MNDFSELENELRKVRPVQPSPLLFKRVGQSLEDRRESTLPSKASRRSPYSWWSLGFGVATAAIMVLFVVISFEREHKPDTKVVQSSPAPEMGRMRPETSRSEQSPATGRFVPAGGTNMVYHARDEGLHFADGSERPVRRLRYHTQQTWRWRNPETGASLRVSYPSEEIVLIPVSGQ